MKRPLPRQVLAYALGLVTAGTGFAAAAAWAGHTAAGDNTITACASKGEGTLYLPSAAKEKEGKSSGLCRRGDQTVLWSITGPQGPQGIQGIQGIQGPQGDQGPQGPAGTIARAVSPNGAFTVTLSNAGILLKGPSNTFTITFAGLHMNTIGGAP